MQNTYLFRVGSMAGVLAAALLVAQIGLGIRIGTDLAALESVALLPFINLVAAHAQEVEILMALDDVFVVAYLIAFLGFVAAVWDKRALATLALGAAIALALLDFLENSLTLGLVNLYLSEQTLNRIPSLVPDHLLALNVIGQFKWLAASAAAASLGIAVWDGNKINRAVGISFLIFVPLAAWGMFSNAGSTARVLWLLVMLIAGAVFLMRRVQDSKSEVALPRKM